MVRGDSIRRGWQAALRLALAAGFTVLATAASARLIDFEAGPGGAPLLDGEPVGSTFSILDVLFGNATVLSSGIGLDEFEFPPKSGTNVAFDDGGAIELSFLFPMTSVGGFFTHAVPLTLTAYLGASPVATVTSATGSNLALGGEPGSAPNEWLAIDFAAGFTRVVIAGDPLGGSFALDDLAFDSTLPRAVAEPGSVALALAAFTALLGWRRRPARV